MSAGNFDGGPELGSFGGPSIGSAPSFQIEFDGLAQIGACRFDVFPLRSYTKFGASRDIPIVFLGDEGREPIVHKAMLTKASVRGKPVQRGGNSMRGEGLSPVTCHSRPTRSIFQFKLNVQ